MAPRCVSIAGRITDHITENYPLEVPQARATELPPPTKSRFAHHDNDPRRFRPRRHRDVRLSVHDTRPRLRVEETTSSSKQRMKTKTARKVACPERGRRGRRHTPADKSQILMALTPRPATSSDCVWSWNWATIVLPLLYMTADIEFERLPRSCLCKPSSSTCAMILTQQNKYNLKIPQIMQKHQPCGGPTCPNARYATNRWVLSNLGQGRSTLRLPNPSF